MTPRVELAARKLLDFMEMTKCDLAKEVFCHEKTAHRMLLKLHGENFLRISAWRKAHNQWIPVYSRRRDKRKDMPKPEPLTSGERYRRYMDEEKSWDQAMKKRAKRLMEKVGI